MAVSCVLPSSDLFTFKLPRETYNCKTAWATLGMAVRFNARSSALDGICCQK